MIKFFLCGAIVRQPGQTVNVQTAEPLHFTLMLYFNHYTTL